MTARQCRLAGLFCETTHGLLVAVVAGRLAGQNVLDSCSNALAVVRRQEYAAAGRAVTRAWLRSSHLSPAALADVLGGGGVGSRLVRTCTRTRTCADDGSVRRRGLAGQESRAFSLALSSRGSGISCRVGCGHIGRQALCAHPQCRNIARAQYCSTEGDRFGGASRRSSDRMVSQRGS